MKVKKILKNLLGWAALVVVFLLFYIFIGKLSLIFLAIGIIALLLERYGG